MTDASVLPRRYIVTGHGESGEQPAGVVSIAPDGVLTILSAEPAFAYKLDLAVNNMNAMRVEHVDIPPPPDAPRFTLRSRIIQRGDPAFVPALITHLRDGYELELRPA